MRVLAFSRPYLSANKGKVVIYAIVSIMLWVVSLLTPYSVGNYIDKLLYQQKDSVIWNTVSILGILWTLQIVLSYVKNLVLSSLHSKVFFQINADALAQVSRLPIDFFSTSDHASMNQRISSDAKTITGYVLGEVQNVIIFILTIACTCCIVGSINLCVLIILVFLLPLYVLIYCGFKKTLYKLRYKVSEEYSRYYSLTNQFLANIKLIKLQEWHSRFSNKLSEAYAAVHEVTMQNAKVGYILSNTDTLIRYLTNITIFIYCGYQMLEGDMSVGEFTMINSYSLMVISCMGNILQFGKAHQHAIVSYDRIHALYQREQEGCGTIQLDSVSEIAATNLSFSYGSKAVFKNLNFTLEKGKIYSIIGENGSGKSTLINILCGLEQKYSGTVTCNGTNIKLLDHRYQRKHVYSIVEQEPSLIFPTLRENIVDSSDMDDKVIQWINALNMTEFMSMINNDLNYHISDQTSNLSGGEKQKIATIRCLVKDTDVLILDEPNSAFDEEGTAMLCRILEQIKHDKIIIVITHRPELKTISDVIISLDSADNSQ